MVRESQLKLEGCCRALWCAGAGALLNSGRPDASALPHRWVFPPTDVGLHGAAALWSRIPPDGVEVLKCFAVVLQLKLTVLILRLFPRQHRLYGVRSCIIFTGTAIGVGISRSGGAIPLLMHHHCCARSALCYKPTISCLYCSLCLHQQGCCFRQCHLCQWPCCALLQNPTVVVKARSQGLYSLQVCTSSRQQPIERPDIMDYGGGDAGSQGQDALDQLLLEGTGADASYAQYIPITDTIFDSCVQGLIEQAEQPKFGGVPDPKASFAAAEPLKRCLLTRTLLKIYNVTGGQHKGAKVPPASIAGTPRP